jgi:hypothetical protein
MKSAVKLVPAAELVISTSGASLVTVTVSSSSAYM